jgi:hypothetical protein
VQSLFLVFQVGFTGHLLPAKLLAPSAHKWARDTRQSPRRGLSCLVVFSGFLLCWSARYKNLCWKVEATKVLLDLLEIDEAPMTFKPELVALATKLCMSIIENPSPFSNNTTTSP